MTKERYIADEYGQILKDGAPLTDFVKELNHLENTRKRYKQHIEELREINSLCFEVIDGFIAYNSLRYRGLLDD